MYDLNDIPYDVFFNFFFPHMDIKDIGRLSQINKAMKNNCNTNEIWKELYMITTKPKILDTSVHFGHKWFRSWVSGKLKDASGQPREFSEYHMKNWKGEEDERIKSWDLKPVLEPMTFHSGFIGYNERYYHNCFSKYGTNSPFPSWSDTGIPWDNTKVWMKDQPLERRNEFFTIIYKVWVEQNRRDGYSTVNLCRCRDHYLPSTIGNTGIKINYSNYKKRTLSKYRTKAKNKISPLKINLDKKNMEIQEIEKKLQNLRNEAKSINREYKKNINLTNNLTETIGNL